MDDARYNINYSCSSVHILKKELAIHGVVYSVMSGVDDSLMRGVLMARSHGALCGNSSRHLSVIIPAE